jgi:hypothetical protein
MPPPEPPSYPGQPYLAQNPGQPYPAQSPTQPYPGQYPAQYYAGASQQSKTLGVVAFVAGLVVTVVSPIVSAVSGATLGHLVKPGDGFSAGFAAGANSHDPQTALIGLLIVAQLLVGSGLGIWALVQGIIAVRRRRGRGWGIAAIVLAAAAPVISFIVYIVAIAATQSAG